MDAFLFCMDKSFIEQYNCTQYNDCNKLAIIILVVDSKKFKSISHIINNIQDNFI